MPVHEHCSYTASCDECDWFEDGFETENAGLDALDGHIERKH